MIPYEQVLLDCIATNENVVVITAENRGHMRNLPAHIQDRFYDVGIAEMTMIGAAAGMALRGRTVITHALASFITLRAFEFIRDDVGMPNLPVIMVGMVPGFLSDGNGPTHQAIDDVSIMRGIPNVGVFAPSDEKDLVIGLKQIVLSGKPFYVRYINTPAIVEHKQDFEIGKAETLLEDNTEEVDITILSYGFMVNNSYKAALLLEQKGLRVRVVNMRTVWPADTEVIHNALHTSTVVTTIEDHFKVGGLYSIVAEYMAERNISANIHPIALDGRWFKPGRLHEVLEYEGFTSEQLAERIEDKFEQVMLTQSELVESENV